MFQLLFLFYVENNVLIIPKLRILWQGNENFSEDGLIFEMFNDIFSAALVM